MEQLEHLHYWSRLQYDSCTFRPTYCQGLTTKHNTRKVSVDDLRLWRMLQVIPQSCEEVAGYVFAGH